MTTPDNAEISTAERVRHRVERAKNRFWMLPGDFASEPRYDAVLRQLARMVDAGELLRIRRGLYWRGSIGPEGMVTPTGLQVAQKVMGVAGVGYAGASAAQVLSLHPGRLELELIASPARPPRDLSGIAVRFLSRAGRIGRLQHHLTATEVALLEVLQDPDTIVATDEEALSTLGAYLSDAVDVRPTRLVQASASEPAIVRAGLRNLFEAQGRSDEAGKILPVRSRAVLARAFGA